MSAPFLTRQTMPKFRERLEHIAPLSHRQWGELEPPAMLAHLRRTIEISLGEIEDIKDESTVFSRTVIWWFAFHLMTDWPKGKLKAPDYFFIDTEDTIEQERARLLETMDRFIEASESTPDRKTLSPLLGMKTLRAWRRIHGIHMDHHLRQFGE